MVDSFFGGLSMIPGAGIVSLGYFVPKGIYEYYSGEKMYPDIILMGNTPQESWQLIIKYSFD